jgi:hypothetical protein
LSFAGRFGNDTPMARFGKPLGMPMEAGITDHVWELEEIVGLLP